jgi:hypothetical protein
MSLRRNLKKERILPIFFRATSGLENEESDRTRNKEQTEDADGYTFRF